MNRDLLFSAVLVLWILRSPERSRCIATFDWRGGNIGNLAGIVEAQSVYEETQTLSPLKFVFPELACVGVP